MHANSGRAYLGIDLGGTGIKGSIVHEDGSFGEPYMLRTPVELGRDGIMNTLENVIDRLLKQADGLSISGIGVGSAGRIDASSGVVIYATDNLPGWTGTPIAQRLGSRFGYPVAVDNDVNAAAVGEGWIGAAKEEDTFAFVALGTGVGGAVVANGALIRGFQGSAGELGHLITVPGGHPCNCGQKGCLEQYVSGTALNRLARALSPDSDSRRLMEAYVEGEVHAQEVIHTFADYLAIGLINVQRMLDPNRIVLGGGLVDARNVWWEPLMLALREQSTIELSIVPARLGNQAGMLGAARLAMLAGIT
jgi:glucokinase